MHRVPGSQRQAVFAYKEEIDEWLEGKRAPDASLTKNASAVATPIWSEFPEAQATQHQTENSAETLAPNAVVVTVDGTADNLAPARLGRSRRRKTAWTVTAALVVIILAWALRPQSGPKVLGFRQLTNDGYKKIRGRPLLTDGVRVYFWEQRGSGLVLASVPIQGGEAAEVSIPRGFLPTDISKDGSEFLGDESTSVGVESIVTLPTAGGPLHWLMRPMQPARQEIWAPGGCWSPRGKWIAFWVQSDVFEAGADGSRVLKLAHVNGWPSWPHWSPDGRRLCFSVENPKSEKFGLWEINANGARFHLLISPENSGFNVLSGAWMPDGRYIIFDAERNGRYDVWALRDRRGRHWTSEPKPVRLTSGPLNYRCPLPSRDGKEVFVLGEDSRGELMRYDPKSREFIDFMNGISAAEADFSRDGQWVTYVRYPDYTLWRARSDGRDALQLTFPPLQAREPHWSPDGRQIAFQGISSGPKFKIDLVSSSGGLIREAVPGRGEESVATWSPDGQSLFYGEPLYRHDVSQMFIHRLDLKTGKTFEIPGSAGMWTARLSPDGRYIAALDATPIADSQRLFIIETATGRRILTITMPELINEPTWSRDERFVYFATVNTPVPALYRVRVRDKKLELITSLKGFPVAGLWTGVAPDGSPLLLRDISTEEIYAVRVGLP
ncbi:MAG TPA: hypothetical protein VGY31_11620 [Terriglobia bacterium]|nr:hypothetical protein [Terriglobia bacterium]